MKSNGKRKSCSKSWLKMYPFRVFLSRDMLEISSIHICQHKISFFTSIRDKFCRNIFSQTYFFLIINDKFHLFRKKEKKIYEKHWEVLKTFIEKYSNGKACRDFFYILLSIKRWIKAEILPEFRLTVPFSINSVFQKEEKFYSLKYTEVADPTSHEAKMIAIIY